MNAYEQIVTKQIQWAQNKGLELVGGSEGYRGRKSYTQDIQDNLFQALNPKTKSDITSGDGSELNDKANKPAKMQALHSSSALCVNVFDYWRDKPDLAPLLSACGLLRSKQLSGSIQFEQKFTILPKFQKVPNLDVVVELSDSHRYKAFAIECKFSEAYSNRKDDKKKFDQIYLDNGSIWKNLGNTKQLARDLSLGNKDFQYLDVAQLIKHILGLNKEDEFGHGKYRLLYLWYDALGQPGCIHRQEVDDFADIAKSDEVVFSHTTYQDMICGIAEHREQHPEYVRYLTERYL